MIVDSKNIPQFIDELNIEIDQIKKELQQTIKNVEYASEYSEGVKLGDLLVGSQSTQVIAPQIALTPGPESGQFFLELPVGTESALTLPVGTESGQIVRPEVQNDANATSLVPEALLTGKTVESYLNSNFGIKVFPVNHVQTTATGQLGLPSLPANANVVSSRLIDDSTNYLVVAIAQFPNSSSQQSFVLYNVNYAATVSSQITVTGNIWYI